MDNRENSRVMDSKGGNSKKVCSMAVDNTLSHNKEEGKNTGVCNRACSNWEDNRACNNMCLSGMPLFEFLFSLFYFFVLNP